MDTEVLDENDPLFNGIPTRFKSGRYHSWAVSPDHFPDCLRITAKGPENTIMALRHRDYNVCGVQFHPESILTEHGRVMMKNWLKQERSEEHTSELQSLMRISYAVFCLKKKI